MLRMMPSGSTPKNGEWECMECGYIEVGVRARRPAVCFECGTPEKALEFFPYEKLDTAVDEDWDADDLDADPGKHNSSEEDDY